jgi:aspartate/methionine/tyrosine aminotransferase
MYGFTVPGVIALWSGEGNLPTPEAFARPAVEALLNGETFYTWQRGLPELRAALARYHERHFGRSFDQENFFVTSGGMQAIQTIVQMIAAAGDEIVMPSPAWPNYAGTLRLHGVKPVDEEILTLMDRSALAFQVVMTKADKVSKTEREATLVQVRAALAKHPAGNSFPPA